MDALDGGLQWPPGNAVWCVNMPGCLRAAMAGGLARCVEAGGRCRVVGVEGKSEVLGPQSTVPSPRGLELAAVVKAAVEAAMEATGKRLEVRVEQVLRGSGAVREEKVELSEEEQRRFYACMLGLPRKNGHRSCVIS